MGLSVIWSMILGRHPTGVPPKQQLRHLTPRHIRMMEMLALGMPQIEVARRLKISQPRLSIICNSPLFKRELSKLQKRALDRAVEDLGDISARVRELQPKALDTLEKIMQSGASANVRRASAKDILDLGMAERKRGVDGESDFATFIREGFEAAAKAQQAAEDAKDKANNRDDDGVIDITPGTFDEARALPAASSVLATEEPEEPEGPEESKLSDDEFEEEDLALASVEIGDEVDDEVGDDDKREGSQDPPTLIDLIKASVVNEKSESEKSESENEREQREKSNGSSKEKDESSFPSITAVLSKVRKEDEQLSETAQRILEMIDGSSNEAAP